MWSPVISRNCHYDFVYTILGKRDISLQRASMALCFPTTSLAFPLLEAHSWERHLSNYWAMLEEREELKNGLEWAEHVGLPKCFQDFLA